MKVFNPTPESVFTKYHGITYPLSAGHFIDVTEATGSWILDGERWGKFGIVDITPKVSDREKLQRLIVEKSLEGLDKYISHLHEVVEGYMTFDTEMKTHNIYGTIMQHKNVKQHTKNLEIATRMVKDLESKYGISIAKAETEEKTNNLLHSIDSMVAAFEKDTVAQEKAKDSEIQLNAMIKEVIAPTVFERSKEAN